MRILVLSIASGLFSSAAMAQANAPDFGKDKERSADSVIIVGRTLHLVGEAVSASEGSIGQSDLADRPLLRSGDLLEFVPGLVATQHSGSGKAQQYFLRGFNLDHGTDFATSVDAMPVNMRTHGHGQGWTDVNFLIPEAVEELTYRKGTYYPEVGDFSSAGSARFHIADRVGSGLAELTAGSFGYVRGVAVNSVAVGAGDLLYGVELQAFDGPWDDIEENVEKVSGVLRYSFDIGGGRAHAMVMGYDNSWNSHDQIPQRAVDQGLISAFGSLDTTVGGEASRYSLSTGWNGPALGGQLDVAAYVIDSSLDLFLNFTYFLDNPVDGDQFEQVDDRQVYGFDAAQQWDLGRSRIRVGAQGRYDDIGQVALFHTKARDRLSTVRDDDVGESSIGIFASHEYRFSEQFRSYLGLRYDYYDFDVLSRSLAVNSGEADDATPSLKASLIYRPLDPLEFYASYGQGFHSNDARGTTIRIDPVTGDPALPVDPLVDSEGAELGARLHVNDRIQATAALWTLRLDSELLFVGDAGNTEAGRPSERTGVEAGIYYFASDNLSGDFEVSYSDAKFTDNDPAGEKIAGSIPLVISGGITAKTDSGYVATLRARYFGSYPLIEDDSVESDGSTVLNLRLGKTWGPIGLSLDVLNLLDSDDHDIDYYYASRLPGEPAAGVDDIHFNVFQKRSFRANLRYTF